MRSLHGFLTRAAAIGVLAACCAAPVGAAEDADTAGYVIPPGQEELLLTMLGRGASLPDGCSSPQPGVCAGRCHILLG